VILRRVESRYARGEERGDELDGGWNECSAVGRDKDPILFIRRVTGLGSFSFSSLEVLSLLSVLSKGLLGFACHTSTGVSIHTTPRTTVVEEGGYVVGRQLLLLLAAGAVGGDGGAGDGDSAPCEARRRDENFCQRRLLIPISVVERAGHVGRGGAHRAGAVSGMEAARQHPARECAHVRERCR